MNHSPTFLSLPPKVGMGTAGSPVVLSGVIRRRNSAGHSSQFAGLSDPSTGRKEVFFEPAASSAKEVLLAGDFTASEKSPVGLRKEDRGTWNTPVPLASGRYHDKFVVDGLWKDDPQAPGSCPNPFGTSDSVLDIP